MKQFKNPLLYCLLCAFLAVFTTQCGGGSSTDPSENPGNGGSNGGGNGSGNGGNGGSSNFTISVTVEGLENSLRLSLNDNENLTISEDGTFAFDTEFSNDDDYEVVLTRPSNDQTCTLSNDEGTVAGNTTVSIECDNKSWDHPNSLSDFISILDTDELTNVILGTTSYEPTVDVAIDDLGFGYYAWVQNDGEVDRVYVRSTTDDDLDLVADAFGPETSATAPKLASNGDGMFVIAFEADSNIYMSYIDPRVDDDWLHTNSPMTSDEIISIDGEVAEENPAVAVSSNNNAIVAWVQDDSTGNKEIYATIYSSSEWTHEIDADDDGVADGIDLQTGSISSASGTPEDLQVKMDREGNAVLVWKDASSKRLFANVYDAETETWTSDRLLSIPTRPIFNPRLAMNNLGQAIVVWSQEDSDGVDKIFKVEYDTSTETWTSRVEVSHDASDAGNPDVAIVDNGDAVIVWEQTDSSNVSQIYMTEYRGDIWTYEDTDDTDYDTSAGLSRHISTSGTGLDAYSPRVAMANNDNAIIVWSQQTEEGTTQVFIDDYDNEHDEWLHDDFFENDDPNDDYDHGQVPIDFFISVEDLDATDTNAYYPVPTVSDYGDVKILWIQKYEHDYDTNEGYYHLFVSEYE